MYAEFILESIAEIGASLAGFAGIVGALAGDKLRPADPELWLPFWVMISSGLSIVFAALFPFLPYQFGLPETVSWAASSAFASLLTVGNLALFAPAFMRARRAGALGRTVAFDVVLYVLSSALLISQVLNALGIGLTRGAAGFLAGLYLMLSISALNFVFLIYVSGVPRRGQPAA